MATQKSTHSPRSKVKGDLQAMACYSRNGFFINIYGMSQCMWYLGCRRQRNALAAGCGDSYRMCKCVWTTGRKMQISWINSSFLDGWLYYWVHAVATRWGAKTFGECNGGSALCIYALVVWEVGSVAMKSCEVVWVIEPHNTLYRIATATLQTSQWQYTTSTNWYYTGIYSSLYTEG